MSRHFINKKYENMFVSNNSQYVLPHMTSQVILAGTLTGVQGNIR